MDLSAGAEHSLRQSEFDDGLLTASEAAHSKPVGVVFALIEEAPRG
jgi:hypothetical protein